MSFNRAGWKWKRPSGREIETNDEPATVKHCQDMGWDRMEGKGSGMTAGDTGLLVEQSTSKIKEAVALIMESPGEDDLMQSGAPKVEAVEALLGEDITADERDMAYAEIMKAKDSDS